MHYHDSQATQIALTIGVLGKEIYFCHMWRDKPNEALVGVG